MGFLITHPSALSHGL